MIAQKRSFRRSEPQVSPAQAASALPVAWHREAVCPATAPAFAGQCPPQPSPVAQGVREPVSRSLSRVGGFHFLLEDASQKTLIFASSLSLLNTFLSYLTKFNLNSRETVASQTNKN